MRLADARLAQPSGGDLGAVCVRVPCSLSFDHPNLVRALHYARLRINPNSADTSLVSGSAAFERVLLSSLSSLALHWHQHTHPQDSLSQRQDLHGDAPRAAGQTLRVLWFCWGFCRQMDTGHGCLSMWHVEQELLRLCYCRESLPRLALAVCSCLRVPWVSLTCPQPGLSSRGRGWLDHHP